MPFKRAKFPQADPYKTSFDHAFRSVVVGAFRILSEEDNDVEDVKKFLYDDVGREVVMLYERSEYEKATVEEEGRRAGLEAGTSIVEEGLKFEFEAPEDPRYT